MRIQPSLRVGHNRTGLSAASDEQRRRMLDVPRELGPTSRGSSDEIARVRIRYARTGMSVGTMPEVPRAQRGLLPLHDLLGARLQFERTGVRMYDALLSKLDAHGGFSGGPDRGDLEQLRDEELAHMRMLEHMLEETGADPTVVTPTADLQSMATRGVSDVLMDPRTTLLDGLGVIIMAELADHEEWIGLIDLGRDLGRNTLVHSFQSAQLTEEEHLIKVRRWLHAGRMAARAELEIH